MANRRIAIYGIIIATYTAISLLLGSLSFGMIQIRVAELLLILCLYDSKYIIPITLGCFATNFIGVMNGLNPIVIDVVVGSLATLISAICVYSFRNIKVHDIPLLSLFIPTVVNGIMVGIELCFYFSVNIWLMMLYVAIGEFVSVTLLGLLLYKPIGKAIKQYIGVL